LRRSSKRKRDLGSLPYIDSDVFIYAAPYGPKEVPEAERAKSWLQRMARG
jgi:hypothetical protein